MPGAMIVVVPLGAIFSIRRLLLGIQQACAVVTVFEYEMNMSASGFGKLTRGNAEFVQHGLLARNRHDVVGGVQPKTVEAVVAQPAKRILDGKGAYLRHAIVDGAAPGRMRIGEKARRIAAEVIPFGTEMIVDDVEKHHQSAKVGFVDE